MAWRSSGDTNEEMVDNLRKYGVITSDCIEKAFRNVDRKYFIPKDNEDSAYSDTPLKEGHIHISAPHIYGSALEALELQPNSSLSFCNIGSGTGYLSCIVADVLGRKSVNYGIEIYQEVVDHCNASIREWKKSKSFKENHPKDFAHLQIVHGNALNVSSSSGESVIGFDRIYIGASVSKANLPHITKLLSPGGILVGPVDDELVKIVRIGPMRPTDRGMSSHASCGSANESVNYVPTSASSDTANENNEFTQQILSGVRFALLVNPPAKEITIPSRLWSPNIHKFYPDSFRDSSMQLLLCSNSDYLQPLTPPKPKGRFNLAATLPRVIWLEILSYTHRKWFDSKETETEFLKKRLLEEQANAAKAQQARVDAEARCHVAERERDVYRLLARRWQSRLQLVLQQQRHMVESGVMPLSPQFVSNETNDNPEDGVVSALATLLPQIQDNNVSLEEDANAGLYFSGQDSSSSMEEDNEDEEERDAAMIVQENQQLIFLEQHHDSDDDEYDFHSLHSDHDEDTPRDSVAQRNDSIEEDNESVTMEDTSEEVRRIEDKGQTSTTQITQGREFRTVSMCSDDL